MQNLHACSAPGSGARSRITSEPSLNLLVQPDASSWALFAKSGTLVLAETHAIAGWEHTDIHEVEPESVKHDSNSECNVFTMTAIHDLESDSAMALVAEINLGLPLVAQEHSALHHFHGLPQYSHSTAVRKTLSGLKEYFPVALDRGLGCWLR